MGLLAVGMALVIGLAWAAVATVSENRLNTRVEVPRETIAVPTDITSIQRGQHLASAVAACVDCHGPNLAGKIFVDDPALGRIVSPNLTRGRGGWQQDEAGLLLRHSREGRYERQDDNGGEHDEHFLHGSSLEGDGMSRVECGRKDALDPWRRDRQTMESLAI